MPFFEALIGSIAGPLIGGILGGSSARSTNQSNQAIAAQETAFNQASAREANELNWRMNVQNRNTTEVLAREATKSTEGMTASALAMSKSQFDKSQAFNERMSNTAYSRGVKDLKTAGLNPILAATRGMTSSPTVSGGPTASGSGTGGSAGGGSATSARASTFRRVDEGLAAMSSAMSLGRAEQELEAMRLANEARKKYGHGTLADKAETIAKTSTSLKKDIKSKFLRPAAGASKKLIAVTKGKLKSEASALRKAQKRNSRARGPRSNWGLWDKNSPYNKRN